MHTGLGILAFFLKIFIFLLEKFLSVPIIELPKLDTIEELHTIISTHNLRVLISVPIFKPRRKNHGN